MKMIIILACLLPAALPVSGEISSVPGVVTGNNVNLRVSPSRKSEIVGQLQRGRPVQVLLTDGDWCAIIPPPGIAAWISAQYVKEGVVTGSRVNVRSGPGVSYGRLTYLRKGAVVSVLEEKDGWVRIELPPTGRLWVSARYIGAPGEGVVKPEETFRPKVMVSREVSTAPAVETPRHEEREPAVSRGTALSAPAPRPPPSRPRPAAPTPYRPARVDLPGPSPPARSYTGFIRALDQPFTTAGREYAYQLLKSRYDETVIGFLTGDTIDLKKFQSRKVRIWAAVLEKRSGHPALMEIKGAGFMW